MRDRITDCDLVLTTYGTLRRDAAHMKEIEFDYVVLDEAQAIKNAASASAKAARLLNARHRLALSGTPIENHVRELWSLFEFLNPGLLGSAAAFASVGSGRAMDEDVLAMLSRGLRPFILRRTKSQVAPELPPKTEQTMFATRARAADGVQRAPRPLPPLAAPKRQRRRAGPGEAAGAGSAASPPSGSVSSRSHRRGSRRRCLRQARRADSADRTGRGRRAQDTGLLAVH